MTDPPGAMTRFRSSATVAILLIAAGACGPFCGNGKFNLSNPHIAPTSFACPPNSDNLGYDMQGRVDADNQTGSTVTIKSMATDSVITAIHGKWNGAVGDKSGSSGLPFSPKSVSSGARATLSFKTFWSCTSTATRDPQSYADFKIVLTIVASSGTYRVTLPTHRLQM